MKTGDKLRISEKQYHKQERIKVIEGKISSINDKSITIIKEKNGFRESFTIGDLITKGKKIQINSGNGWERLEFKMEGNKCKATRYVKPN